MDDAALDALNADLGKISDKSLTYIDAADDNDFVLDGHFTLEELKAIVQCIEQHISLT